MISDLAEESKTWGDTVFFCDIKSGLKHKAHVAVFKFNGCLCFQARH